MRHEATHKGFVVFLISQIYDILFDATNINSGVLLKQLKYFKVMLNIFEFSRM